MKVKISKEKLLFPLLTIPVLGFSQMEKTVENIPESMVIMNEFDYLLFVSAGIIVLIALYTLVKLMNLWTKLKENEIYEQTGYIPVEKVKEKTITTNWIKELFKKATDTVPIAKEKEILLSHNYDGIQELDNNLPPWWLYGFYLTIGIAIFYIGYFHFSENAISSQESYSQEMALAKMQVDAYNAKRANLVNENSVVALEDAELLAEGQSLFNRNCIACHLESGGGSPISVGPNLTDQYWIHGGGIKNVFKTIKYGVPEKGMIAWKNQMSASDIHKVASYVISLQGTNPPNAKEPQGELYSEEEANADKEE